MPSELLLIYAEQNCAVVSLTWVEFSTPESWMAPSTPQIAWRSTSFSRAHAIIWATHHLSTHGRLLTVELCWLLRADSHGQESPHLQKNTGRLS